MPTQLRGYCTLCRSRCGTLNTVHNDALIRVTPDSEHPTGQAMCTKGRAAPELVHSPHRVLYPMRRTTPKGSESPGWQRISWDEALNEIARRLTQIRDESGAEAVAFGVTTPSGTPLSDSIDWIERFVRGFGSPNIAYGTEVCNWHKDYAHAFTFGCGIPVADYRNAGLMMLWGHNPTNTWLAQANAIAEGRRAGGRLLVIDPRPTALATEADVWLQVKPGTDAALALGLVNLVLESGQYDDDFVRRWTNAPLLVRTDTGKFLRAADVWPDHDATAWVAWNQRDQSPIAYDTRREMSPEQARQLALTGDCVVNIDGESVLCQPAMELLLRRCSAYSPAHVSNITGVSPDKLHAAADLIIQSSSMAYHSWSGVAQSVNATQTERAIAILYALTGSFDRQGGNRVYAKHPVNAVNGLDLIPASQRAKALGLQQRPLGPAVMGWITAHDMYRAVLTDDPYRVRAFVGFGTNQLSSQGDVAMAEEAYRQLEFHVHCDLFETPTARYADIFLPVNTPWEREGLRLGFEITQTAQEHIQLRPQMVSSRGESRSDTEIVFELARRMGMGDRFFDGDVERGWNHQLAPLGICVEDLRREGSIRRPLPHNDRKYSLPTEPGGSTVIGFDTETRRVEMYSERLLRHGYEPLPHHSGLKACTDQNSDAYPFTLTSAKSGYFCHSQHRSLPSLRKRAPNPEAVINASVADAKGIQSGDWIRLTTPFGSARFVATLDPQLSKDVISADFGWWQACTELGEPAYPVSGPQSSNYNALVSAKYGEDPISGSVPMRHFVADVALDTAVDPAQRRWSGFIDFRVTHLKHETPDVLELTLSARDGRLLPDYRPGQHITLEATLDDGSTLTRSYSLVGPAHETRRKTYRIAVRRQSGRDESQKAWLGAMSGYLHDRIQVGSELRVGAPGGIFVLPAQSPQPVVLFAGGIGITPFLSYLESLVGADDMPEVWLFYANRNGQTKAYADRLEALLRELPRLSVLDFFSEPLTQDGRQPELLGAHVVSDALIEARARFYMCGPPIMMDYIQEGLCQRGVPAFDIFREVFRSPLVVDLEDIGPYEVRFARSDNTTATWTAKEGTLLSFGEKHGLALPSGCRVGQCESCAVRVVSGQVRHLQGAEPDDPSICFTCQAIPMSDVVLDI